MKWNLQSKNICNIFVSLLLAYPLVSCNADTSKAQHKLKTKDIAIENSDGISIAISAELAITDEDRSTGLMFRKNLEDGDGMLFVYEKDTMMSFWMKNTLIPLSIAFIKNDGTIIDIFDMYPQNTNSIKSTRSCRYALEVPMGYFARNNIVVGNTVKL